MKYGIEVVPFGDFSNPREVMRVAQAAEAAGWEALCVWDHLIFPWGAGDPWVTLSAVAATTDRLKLITGVSPVPRYRPHALARTLSALDILSEGRMIFGAGLGLEWDMVPVGDPGDAKVRAATTDEALDLMARLWSGEAVTHHGTYFRADGVQLAPSPVQRPRIPVWIGGESKPALRRSARWDGWIMGTIDENSQITCPPEKIAQDMAYIREHLPGDAGFDVAVSGVTAAGDSTLPREYADAGATWWLESIFGLRGSMEELLARIEAGPPRSA